ncbi:MAG TPA: DNA methyltransferase [Candidatus Saccharimonadales bacterium]|nr:DNA methyltransferase [Candidatus Saccharimonadales bacterium]
MTSFNDFNADEWKESEILTDSLWVIPERDKSGKHNGFYHGNFIPQIPHQLILRYTKKNDVVFDAFVGSGTTVFESETLKRKCIGVDIQQELITYIDNQLEEESRLDTELIVGDSTKPETYSKVGEALKRFKKEKVDLAILHPPYADIVKFSNLDDDLSNSKSLNEFIEKFTQVLKHTTEILHDGRYLVIVIGDKYTQGQWIPLGFYCMNAAQKCGLTLKSIVIKNMEGNRAKQNKTSIWRYRALKSDYYIFKHEYILVFKKP